MSPFFREQTLLTRLIWFALIAEAALAVIELRFALAFIALLTLALSMAPALVARWAEIVVPKGFILAVVLFIASTVFLGEVYDFYNRLWWWDIAMHGGSAIGFGLVGFILVFMMFQGDRYAAPPWAMGLLGASIGIMIGVLWEIFEFAMDQAFGLNMQKSGLPDTMGDLIVDVIGASLGGTMGGLYLRGLAHDSISKLVDEFVSLNSRFFSRFRRKR